jgi:hypothetical protein
MALGERLPGAGDLHGLVDKALPHQFECRERWQMQLHFLQQRCRVVKGR